MTKRRRYKYKNRALGPTSSTSLNQLRRSINAGYTVPDKILASAKKTYNLKG